MIFPLVCSKTTSVRAVMVSSWLCSTQDRNSATWSSRKLTSDTLVVLGDDFSISFITKGTEKGSPWQVARNSKPGIQFPAISACSASIEKLSALWISSSSNTIGFSGEAITPRNCRKTLSKWLLLVEPARKLSSSSSADDRLSGLMILCIVGTIRHNFFKSSSESSFFSFAWRPEMYSSPRRSASNVNWVKAWRMAEYASGRCSKSHFPVRKIPLSSSTRDRNDLAKAVLPAPASPSIRTNSACTSLARCCRTRW